MSNVTEVINLLNMGYSLYVHQDKREFDEVYTFFPGEFEKTMKRWPCDIVAQVLSNSTCDCIARSPNTAVYKARVKWDGGFT